MKCLNVLESNYVTSVLAGTIQIVVEKVFSFVRVALEIGSSDKEGDGRWAVQLKGLQCVSPGKEPLIELQASTGKWIMKNFSGRLNFYVAAGLKLHKICQKVSHLDWGDSSRSPLGLGDLVRVQGQSGENSLIPFRYDWLGIMRQFWVFSACGVSSTRTKLFLEDIFFLFFSIFFGAWAITQLTQFSICVWVGVCVYCGCGLKLNIVVASLIIGILH